jgi:CBS-domain-containing membrane protein
VKTLHPSSPQTSLLFRVVAVLSRLQLGYLLRGAARPRVVLLTYVFMAGATALGIITAAAYLTRLPLLFPPLGPSAFILFRKPLAEEASPYNVFVAHSLALAAGLLSLSLAGRIFGVDVAGTASSVSAPYVLAIVLAMGLSSVGMILLRCVHPPAVATALLGAMGFFETTAQILGLLAAVALLLLQALLFNRVLGGLPYPFWRYDARVGREYGALAGRPEAGESFWSQLSDRLQRRRRS